MVDVQDIISFGNLGDAEIAEVEALIEAGKAYLKNATGKEFNDENALAVLYLKIWVVEKYENRITDGKCIKTLDGLMTQLKFSYLGD